VRVLFGHGKGRRDACATRVAAVLLLVGLVSCAEAVRIPVKARLAQVLLERAWKRTMTGERGVKPWPWADTKPLARLRFESDGSSVIVLSGASGRTMAFGPGHLDGTALPNQQGNCVISAHRDTHFEALREIMPGDGIALTDPSGETVRYRVRKTVVVEERDTSPLRQDHRERLTLITCYPFEAIVPGGPLRFVVSAERDSFMPPRERRGQPSAGRAS